ncbi:MAG: tRNA pseudouridine(55) synthase TruB [Lachnospiraceae bacterium]|nr:tRNA pseudouridine(55) synthase TruB [Lachnospiraceae bacterium]
MDGILNVYKEKGFTSHDVVAKLRGILRQKKIGHTGTLDPDAEGVLPVCLGRATKVCEFLTDHKKTYRTVLLLGVSTDTQDATGTILKECPVLCDEEKVRRCVSEFVGVQQQIPPMYSALKVNGQKLYDLARKGVEVERAPRTITIEEIVIERISLPLVEMTVRCSKGTYIRTLCNDIGDRLGCGGCMKELQRTQVGTFAVSDSRRLSEIETLRDEGRLEEILFPLDSVFGDFGAIWLTPETERLVRNGNSIPDRMMRGCHMEAARGETHLDIPLEEAPITQIVSDPEGAANAADSWRIYGAQGEFLALYRFHKDMMCWKPVKMFLP